MRDEKELTDSEYTKVSEQIVAMAKAQPRQRVRVTSENIDTVMHGIDE
ncbi:hypothetical protein [Weissella confusa]|nr:hypothetical protein [Weissella confusa]